MISAAAYAEHTRRNTPAVMQNNAKTQDGDFDYMIEQVGDVINVCLKGSPDVRRVSKLQRELDACRTV